MCACVMDKVCQVTCCMLAASSSFSLLIAFNVALLFVLPPLSLFFSPHVCDEVNRFRVFFSCLFVVLTRVVFSCGVVCVPVLWLLARGAVGNQTLDEGF